MLADCDPHWISPDDLPPLNILRNSLIEYKTGPVRAAVVGYWIKAVFMIIGLIVFVSIVDKDGRYESNGKTYEIAINMTALIIIGVISK